MRWHECYYQGVAPPPHDATAHCQCQCCQCCSALRAQLPARSASAVARPHRVPTSTTIPLSASRRRLASVSCGPRSAAACVLVLLVQVASGCGFRLRAESRVSIHVDLGIKHAVNGLEPEVVRCTDFSAFLKTFRFKRWILQLKIGCSWMATKQHMPLAVHMRCAAPCSLAATDTRELKARHDPAAQSLTRRWLHHDS